MSAGVIGRLWADRRSWTFAGLLIDREESQYGLAVIRALLRQGQLRGRLLDKRTSPSAARRGGGRARSGSSAPGRCRTEQAAASSAGPGYGSADGEAPPRVVTGPVDRLDREALRGGGRLHDGVDVADSVTSSHNYACACPVGKAHAWGVSMWTGDTNTRDGRIVLEAPTEFLILARIERGVVQRVRSFTPD